MGMSQQELANKMGYSSRSSVNKIESGRQVTQKIIVRLAEALHTTPSYLMGWDDESTDPLVIEVSKRWMEEVGTVDFTEDETEELINYAKYLISKRI